MLILLLRLLLLMLPQARCTNDMLRLLNQLSSKESYDPDIRPVLQHHESLLLFMNLSLIQIVDVDLKNQFMTIRVHVNQEWRDPNFIWDPLQFGNISEINIPSKDIWTPDLVLYNNAGGDWDLSSSSKTKVKIQSDGMAFWRPPVIFKIQCSIDVEYFPFDSQKCDLKIGTWSHGGNQIDLRHTAQKSELLQGFDNCEREIDYAIDLSHYQEDVEWDLMEVRARRNIKFYACCTDPFLDIRYSIKLRRRILFYGVNLICPCLAISFLTALVFYLPADSHEKISLSINVLINLTVFFLLIFEISPPTSIVVPLILKYLLFTMTLITLSVLMTIIVLNIHWRSPETHIITDWVRTVFTITLPKLLFMAKREKGMSQCQKYDLGTEDYYQLSKAKQVFGLEDDGAVFDVPKWRSRRQAVVSESAISEIQLALEGSRKIVNHVRKKEKYRSMRGDWKYVALVLDRLFLCVFSVAAII
ncbi:hypothetical protein Ciccas_007625, partial [Cichlidogyrus casuarinus]